MNEKAVLYVAIIVAVFVLVISIAAMAQPKYTQSDYQKMKSVEVPNDNCATPAGYTDADWKQHMSHHPDQYAECLK